MGESRFAAQFEKRQRKGAPDTFDAAGYLVTLSRVRQAYRAADVYVPQFDRALEESIAAGLVVPRGARLVVTEGNYLALPSDGFGDARDLIDDLSFLTIPEPERRTRLIARQLEAGRSLIAAERWVASVDESNAVLVAGTESRCDRTVRFDGDGWL